MKKVYPSLALLTLSLAYPIQMNAWAKNGNPNLIPPEEATEEPKDGRSGLFEVDYLLWKPYQEDLNFAIKSTSGLDGTTVTTKYHPKSPDFDLSSGVRVGLGGYTSDTWDVKARATYLYSDTRKNVGTTAVDKLYPSFFPIIEGENGTRANAHWRLNFGLIDLTLGRETFLSSKFSIHPFIGARSVWIRETLKGRFSGTVPTGTSTTALLSSRFKHTNDVWGVGPRAGLDSSYYFERNWSFQGGLSGAFVLGNFHAHQKVSSVASGTPSTTSRNSLKDSNDMIRTNLDGYLGIGWDKWFNKNKNRVYVSLLCETSYWFGINQLMDLNLAQVGTTLPGTSSFVAEKRHGDLAFFGGTLHFQVDF